MTNYRVAPDTAIKIIILYSSRSSPGVQVAYAPHVHHFELKEGIKVITPVVLPCRATSTCDWCVWLEIFRFDACDVLWKSSMWNSKRKTVQTLLQPAACHRVLPPGERTHSSDVALLLKTGTNTYLHVFGCNLSGCGPAVGVGKVSDLGKANTHGKWYAAPLRAISRDRASTQTDWMCNRCKPLQSHNAFGIHIFQQQCIAGKNAPQTYRFMGEVWLHKSESLCQQRLEGWGWTD